MAFTAEFPSQPQATTTKTSSGVANISTRSPEALSAPLAPNETNNVSHAAQAAVRHEIHTLVVEPGRTICSEVWEPASGSAVETVFLLSGVGHWSGMWAATAQRLAQHGVRAIAINYRGHGRGIVHSLWHHHVSEATFAGYVEDTALAIDDAAQRYGLEAGAYSVVGHSMGGGVATLYASQFRVRHYILVGSCAMNMWLKIYGGMTLKLIGRMGGKAMWDGTMLGADALFWDRVHPERERRIRLTLFDAATDPEDVAFVLTLLQPESKTLMPAFFQYAHRRQRVAVREALARNTQDTGIIGFGHDVFFPPAAIQTTADEYGMGDRWVIIPDAPHDGFADRRYAPQFFDALRRLLLGEQVDELAQALPNGTIAGRGEEE